MNNILITGISGFIGRNFIHYKIQHDLNNNEYIYFITSDRNKLNFLQKYNFNYEIIESPDYSTKNLLPDIEYDIVIHLGAFTPKSQIEANDIFRTFRNIESTIKLITSFKYMPKKFLFSSTLDIYSNTEQVIDEQSLITPVSLYGYSKLYCEQLLQHWAKQNNVLLQVMRIGHVYGEGEDNYKKLIPVTIKKILNSEQPIIYGTGSDLRSFLYIEDLIKYFIKIIRLDKSLSSINLVSAKSHSIKEIVNKIIKISGKNIVPKTIHSLSTSRDLVFNISKLEKTLGIKEISIDEGLKREFLYFKSILGS